MGNMPPVFRLTDWFTRVRAAAFDVKPVDPSACAYCTTRTKSADSAYCSDRCENEAEWSGALP